MGISKLAAVAVFLSAQGALASPAFPGQYKTRAQQLLTAYDYVVVGGGASGLTVANRLSENPGRATHQFMGFARSSAYKYR